MNNKIISIDTETKFDKQKCVPIPFIATTVNTKLESRLYELSNEKDYNDLKLICEDQEIIKVFHNCSYDIYVLSNIGINCVGPFEDTMIMATLVNENFDSKKLKILAKVHLKEACLEEAELKKVKAKFKREMKKNLAMIDDDVQESELDDFDYSYIPTDILYPYAIKDAIYTLKLYFLFRKTVYEKYRDLYEFEISLMPIVVSMTQQGFRIDREFVSKMIDDYEKEVDQVFAEMLKYLLDRDIHFYFSEFRKTDKGLLSIIDKHGQDKVKDIKVTINDKDKEEFEVVFENEFNPGSTPHLRKAITALGITVTKTTDKKEEISTDKEAIKTIPKESLNYEFIKLLIRWRFLSKQLSTYYIPLYTRYTNNQNDIAHFIFYQSGAKSGRFTAQLVQTIPREDDVEDIRFIRHIRRAFIPREITIVDGDKIKKLKKILVAIDYDQIEMRIFADFSKCQKLIDDINTGFDPHTGTAYTLFGREQVDGPKYKTLRRIAKNINFGLIYGMGKNKLARSLGIPLTEAFQILEKYHKNYPVKQHIDEQTGILYKQGFVFIESNSELMRFYREYRVPSELAYKAVNIRIQGMAAYCMKYGIKRSIDFINKEKLQINFICSIHDELFFEIDEKDYSVELVANITHAMEDKLSFKVPILASPKVSNESWGAAKELEI